MPYTLINAEHSHISMSHNEGMLGIEPEVSPAF